MVGQVVAVDPEGALRGFERRPLFGRRILITRTRKQASALRDGLETLGAEVIEAPTIRIEPADPTPIDQALKDANRWDWLILTSANGVEALGRRMAALGMDGRHLAGLRIATIGSATAEALGRLGLRADFVPSRFVAESLAEELIARESLQDKKVLMLRADIARRDLARMLAEAGAQVADLDAYRTLPVEAFDPEVLEALRGGSVDWVTFTSSSTVRSMVQILGAESPLLKKTKLASIGPITSGTCRELGLEVAVEAAQHDVEGLIDALVSAEGRS